MALSPGDKLGAYEIVSSIGAGGMGEVWKARDTRLGRFVAIKVSRTEFSRRFEREAQTIAALNHPNICTLHDVGPDFLVMELLDGETLAARLRKGRLTIEQTIQFGAQIAAALAEAHSKGIIHRDLKPGNIMLGKPGVKVLDFGLARSQEETHLTVVSGVIGTPEYMAPEQREGKECQPRTDIYALGLILAEMATGRRGSTEGLPSPLAGIIERCLKADPSDRWQSASDLKAVLELAGQTSVAGTEPARRSGGRWTAIAIGGAALLVLAAIAITVGARLHSTPPAHPVQFDIPVPKEAMNPGVLAVSPDGHYLAFSARGASGAVRRLWLRAVDSGEARMLAGTEGPGLYFWSPDSRFIAYIFGNKLWKVAVDGGPPQAVCECPGSGGTWGRSGVILYTDPAGRLMRVAARGGTPVAVMDAAYLPAFLPDGEHFLYKSGPGNTRVYVGSLNGKSPEKKQEVAVTPFAVVYAPAQGSATAHVLFMRDEVLFAQPFDERRLETVGDPFPLAAHLQSVATVGYFTASAGNVLIYRTTAVARDTQLTWFDRQGKAIETVGEPTFHVTLHLSPDGARAAFTRLESETNLNAHLWLLDLARGAATRLTSGSGSVGNSVWSPDSSNIIFALSRDGLEHLYRKPAGGGDDELLLAAGRADPTSWSPDGRALLYHSYEGRSDLKLLPLQGDHTPATFLKGEFDIGEGRFSPNGRWVAYGSNESGREEVYVREFSSGASAASGTLISKSGGNAPHWRADGKELIYLGANRNLMAVDVDAAAAFHVGSSKLLFQLPLGVNVWDMTSDGKRFLVAVPLAEASPPPFTVVLNWQSKK